MIASQHWGTVPLDAFAKAFQLGLQTWYPNCKQVKLQMHVNESDLTLANSAGRSSMILNINTFCPCIFDAHGITIFVPENVIAFYFYLSKFNGLERFGLYFHTRWSTRFPEPLALILEPDKLPDDLRRQLLPHDNLCMCWDKMLHCPLLFLSFHLYSRNSTIENKRK